MKTGCTQGWWVLVAASVLLLVGPSRAEFVRIVDFDDLDLGPVDGQDGWVAPSDLSMVTTDPGYPANQVLSVVTESTRLYRSVVVPEGTIRMLFFRFRYDDQLNCSFGMSDATGPSQFDHFEAELSLTNAADELRINDDGHYVVLETLQPRVWYSCWMRLDNESDVSEVRLHARPGEPAVAEDQLTAEGSTLFEFRNGTSRDLLNFYIKTGGGNGVDGPLLVDDLYLENTSALNLTSPVTFPTSVLDRIDGIDWFPVSLERPHPNPFRGTTRLDFTLRERLPFRLTILDVTGREVAVLAEGEREAGALFATWRGTDDAGRVVGPGIYFARLQAADFDVSQKLVLIR